MITNKTLYGTDDVPPIPKDIAQKRIDLLYSNLRREVNKPFKEQNAYLQAQILKAMGFWKKMANMEDAGL